MSLREKETLEQLGWCWEGLEDPRNGNAALYDFHELLMIALCCVLCGGQGAVDMAAFAEAKEPFLRGFLALANGLPSHDTHDDVVLLFDDPELQSKHSAPWVEGDHGRIETRTATVSTDIGWLQQEHRWPGLQAIGKVVRVRETVEKTSTETAYYLLSQELAPERFNEVVRQNWSVEIACTGGWTCS